MATTLTPMKLRLEGFASRHLTGERDASVPTASTAPQSDPGAASRRPLSLDDPADVATLEALVERVVRRRQQHA